MKEVAILHHAQRIYNTAFQKALARSHHLSNNERKIIAHRLAWIEVGRLYRRLQRVSNYIMIKSIEVPAVRVHIRG